MSNGSSAEQSRSKVMTSRIAYATGAFGHDIFYATLSTYLIMFITSHLFNSGDAAHNNRMVLYITTIIAVLRIVELFIDPFIGYFRNLYIFGQPAEFVSVVTKIASGVTLVNSLLSTVCAVVLYIALRPALEKAHLLPKE